MNIMWLVALATFLLLTAGVGTLIAKTVRFHTRQLMVKPIEPIELPEAAIVNRLGKAIRIQTVSFDDPAEINYETFHDFHRFIAEEYPGLSRVLTKTVINTYSLLYEWTGTEPNLKPVVLTAHMDVVPVERDRWEADPFGGRVENGHLWGRGTLDDKGSLVSILEAVEHLVKQGYVPRRTIYLGFGHDEERGGPAGIDGAKRIAQFLRERGVHADMAIDEGAILDSSASPVKGKKVALIGITQKGYVSIRLSASAPGGHAMAPPVDHSTVTEQLARAIITLEKNPFAFKIDPSVASLFDSIGPESQAMERVVFANRWLFKPLLIAILARKDTFAALLRTTMAPTVIRAGTKEQSLPETGYAIVNFRTMPGQTSADLLASVHATLKGQPVSVELNGVPHEATPMSRVNSPNFRLIEKTIREAFPETVVAPVLSPGRADAEYYYGLADDVYLFAPYVYSPQLIESVHGHNERIAVENYISMVRFYVRLIENMDGSESTASDDHQTAGRPYAVRVERGGDPKNGTNSKL